MKLTKVQQARLLAHATDYVMSETPEDTADEARVLIKYVNDLVTESRGVVADRGWQQARQERDKYALSACEQLRLGSIDRATTYAHASDRWSRRMDDIGRRYQDQQRRGGGA